MGVNLQTYFIDSALVAARVAEYPALGQFAGGGNLAGSNAGGVGINSGDYDPKAQDWPRIDQSSVGTNVLTNSQVIGGDLSGVFCLDPATTGDDNVVAFGLTTGVVAADGLLFTTAGFAMLNRTGGEVPNASWVWGVGDQV